MKKKIIVLLLVSMVACLLAAPVLADTVPSMTVTASKTSVSAGETITVTVTMSETANCTSVGLGIEYDTAVFEMVEGSFTPLVANTQASCKYNSVAKTYVATIQPENTEKVSGKLFTFQLKVKDGVAIGKSYEISGKTSIRVGGAVATCSINKATVKIVCAHIYDNACDTSCNSCGEKREIKHTYDSGKVTTPATCTKEGVKTYTCTVCGNKKTEAVAKIPHTYDSGKVTTPATCTKEGVKTFTCSCGATRTESIPKTGHNFDAGKVTTPATCTKDGVKTYSCTDSGCTEKYTESIPKTGHSYDNVCDDTCNNCGEKRSVTHTYDSGKITTPATCTKEGVKTFTCSCGATRTEAVPKTGHSYDSGKITTPATCTKEGVKTFTCSCGATRTEKVAKIDHTSDGGKVTIAPNCTEAGIKTYSCSVCGAVLDSETLKAVGHDYASEVTYATSCKEEGLETFSCKNCDHTYTQPIPKDAHKYDFECDPDCNVCGEVRPVEHIYNQRWSADQNGHWHECGTCGDVLELIPHTPGPEATEEKDQICLDCGFVLQAAGTHIHKESGDWHSDENDHWHLCNCGQIMGKEAHTWVLNQVDEEARVEVYGCIHCGLTREEAMPPETQPTEPGTEPGETEPSQPESQPPETNPPTDPTEPGEDKPGQDEEGFPWWIVFLSVGVLLFGAVMFIIIGIAKSKKQVGKYSS